MKNIPNLSRKAGTGGRRAADLGRRLFETRSAGAFLSPDNLRGILGLLPEVELVSIGVTILMICGEFDLSVGSTFALAPMATSLMIIAGVPAFRRFSSASSSPPRSASSTASSL